jgi:RHS repeat-associated protein
VTYNGVTINLDGQRRSLHLPAALVQTGSRDSLSWSYSATTGELVSVTDPLGNAFSYRYTARGDLDTLIYPGSYRDQWTYDADGNITGKTLRNLGGKTGGRWPLDTLRKMALTYDQRGKQLTSNNTMGYQESATNAYTGLGMLARRSSTERNSPGSATTYTVLDSITSDALGNALTRRSVSTLTAKGSNLTWTVTKSIYDAATGRLRVDSLEPGTSIAKARELVYDAAGNLTMSSTLDRTQTYWRGTDRVSYYNALGQVVAVDARSKLGGLDDPAKTYVWEEYRYDALGRRFAVRTLQACENRTYDEDYLVACQISTLRRTVWDGTQELIEIQVPGSASEADSVLYNDDFSRSLPRILGANFQKVNDPNPFFGRVVYTHGLGLDQPVGLTRYRFHTNTAGKTAAAAPPLAYSLTWLPTGRFAEAMCTDGRNLCTFSADTMGLAQPLLGAWAYSRPAGTRSVFQGTLVEDKEDGAGTFYRRNRLYDPATGRFTQEDPIGLAGGMNLYGFANGDPVNFSDPFGLCPPEDNDFGPGCPGYFTGLAGATGAVIGAALGGGAGGTGGAALCSPGGPLALACGSAGAIAGAAAGAAKGAAAGALAGGVLDGAVMFAKKVDIKQVDQAIRQALGRKPTDDERGDFRDQIHQSKDGKDYSFKQLVQLAKELFGRDP